MEGRVKAPFVLKPTFITNYTQLITNLKKIQQKNSKYKVTPHKSEYKDVLKQKKIVFDVHNIVNGYVHDKLSEKQKSHEKEIDKFFKKSVNGYISNLKREHDLFVIGTNKITGNVQEFEGNFDKKPSESMFNNSMLFDLYTFLSTAKQSCDFDQEIAYLGIEYLKYIERFLKENSSKFSIPLRSIEDKVTLYVGLKYNREEYNLEVYEGKYIFAEIYVYLRCGFSNQIFKLFDKYKTFFYNIEPEFKRYFSSWVCTKTRPSTPLSLTKDDDAFKIFLINLMQGEPDLNSQVISSVEDFLWIQLINITEYNTIDDVIRQFDGYKSQKGLLLVLILTKQYEKAIDFIFSSDILIYPSYFLMVELSKKLTKRKKLVDFVFLIASRFNKVQRKVAIINSLLCCIDDYYDVVPHMIVKVRMYEVLGPNNETGTFLDKEVNERVIKILKDINDKKQLLSIHHIIDDDLIVVELLNNVFVEGILTNSDLDEYIKIYDKIEKTHNSKEIEKLHILKMFYLFFKTPDIVTLKKTSLFSLNLQLIEFKFVIEKILKIACEVIKQANDFEMAKKIFKVVGTIELSDDCIKYINKELILFI